MILTRGIAFLIFNFQFITQGFILKNLNLKYCNSSEEIINTDIDCSDSEISIDQCLSFRNSLNILAKFEDEFNFFNNEIIYSKNNEIHIANCTDIDKIEVPELVSNCTRDLLILIENRKAFLTKDGIIRFQSVPIECDDKYYFFEILTDEHIIRQNLNVVLVNKNPLLKSFIPLSNFKTHFFTEYDEFFNIKSHKFFKDLFFFLFFIILIFLTCVSQSEKKECFCFS